MMKELNLAEIRERIDKIDSEIMIFREDKGGRMVLRIETIGEREREREQGGGSV